MPASWQSDAATLVDRGERDRVGRSRQAEVRVANQILDDPACAVAPPVLHPPLHARDQQNLFGRQQLAVVVELATAVVKLSGVG